MFDENAPPPILQRPTYLSATPEALPALKSAAGDCRRAAGENAGLIGATLLGVTAAYFAPKVFDWVLSRIRGEGADQADEYELELDGRG